MKPSGRWPVIEFNGSLSFSGNTELLTGQPGAFFVIGQLDISVSGAVLPVASFIELVSGATSLFKQGGDAIVQPFIQLPGLILPIGGGLTLSLTKTSTEVVTYNGWAEVRG